MRMRDQLLELIYTRLARYAQWRDAGDILDEELRTWVLQLLELLGPQTVDFEAIRAAAEVFWLRHRLLPREQDENDLRQAITLYRVIHQVDPEAVPHYLRAAVGAEDPAGPLIRLNPEEAHSRLLIKLQAAVDAGDGTEVSVCVRELRFLLACTPPGDLNWSTFAATLAGAHESLYRLTADPADLDTEITLFERIAASDHHDADFAFQLQLLGDAQYTRYERSDEPSDLDAAIRTTQRALSLTESGDAYHRTRTYRLGKLLLVRAERSGALADLDDAVENLRISCSTGPDDADQANCFLALGEALLKRYHRKFQPADLDAAILAFTTTMEAAPSGTAHESLCLLFTVAALHDRFALRGRISDCDSAIQILQSALSEQGDTQRAAEQLAMLGIALIERHLASGDMDDLIAAVGAFRASLSNFRADHPAIMDSFSRLGYSLFYLHLYTADAAHLAEAVNIYKAIATSSLADQNLREHATAVCGELRRRKIISGLPKSAVRCQELAAAAESARHKYRTGSAPNELNQAITLTRRLLGLMRSVNANFVPQLCLLSEDLLKRFKRTGWVSDVDEALTTATQATDLATTPESCAAALYTVASAWLASHAITRDRNALDNAIAAAIRSIETVPAGEPNLAGLHDILGICLMHRYEETANIQDALDGAAEFRRALTYIAPGSPRAVVLSNLAAAVRHVYDHTGDLAMLTESIETLSAAAAEGKPSLAMLTNLGHAYMSRYGVTADNADIDRARRAYEEALVDLPPNDADYPAVVHGFSEAMIHGQNQDLDRVRRAVQLIGNLINDRPPSDGLWHRRLGRLLLEVFRNTADPEDLQRAVAAWRRAVELTPTEHTERINVLAGLAKILQSRYEKTRDVQDIVEAEALTRQCLAELPDHSSLQTPLKVLLNLVLRSQPEASNAPVLRAEALQLSCEIAATTATPPEIRALEAGRAAAMYADMNDWRHAAEHYELAVSLLPFVTPQRLLGEQVRVVRPGRLAANGAACWLNADEPERAAVLLELGRAVLFSQAIATRGDLTELRADQPELAARFEMLRAQLDSPDPMDTALAYGVWAKTGPTIDRAATATEFEALLTTIRSISGHERFLLPPAIEDLLAPTAEGPIVLLNASYYRCDALALTPEGVRTVPLPQLSIEPILDHSLYIQMAGANAHNTNLTSHDYEYLRMHAAETLIWLWDNVVAPVLNEVGITRRPPADQWPRIWWVPDGAFSLLPIHAAGHHDQRHTDDAPTLLDRAQSSYTPTVRALIHARTRAREQMTPSRVLVVAMPKTPGQPDLPGAQAEAETIANRFPTTILGPTPIAHNPATRETILGKLPHYPLIHFACHAYGDWTDPSRSFLAIQNDPVTPRDTADALRLADITSLDLRGQRLAYLSACATTRPTNLRLLDEATHFTSAFQQAGFTDVIGTLWEVDDQTAVEFTRTIYARLETAPSIADLGCAASAVHEATRTLREQFINAPVLWASHIHIGP